ncbi:hypothetical protein CKAH01_02301 [Colletotrichum kahawae]|uniref:Uncharacterized protein n=1 Tax=Colletotrichum kahawae TaxID=34407 RepID=A0AAE0D069_COLKA|nr:hypothetical protein CKAH01_02301 [Colletotrichum kahawae]
MIPDLAVHGTPFSDDAAYLSPSSQSYVPCCQERPFFVLVVSAPAEAAKLPSAGGGGDERLQCSVSSGDGELSPSVR